MRIFRFLPSLPSSLVQLFELIQMEAGVSFALRNTIIPNAVDWFTGEAEDDDGACVRILRFGVI